MILYFAKFNPINENHVKIIDYINYKYNPNIFVIIPHNYDLDQYQLKSLLNSIDIRIYLINKRLSIIDKNKTNNIHVWKSILNTGLFNINKISNIISTHFKTYITHVIYSSNVIQMSKQINGCNFKFILINKYNQPNLSSNSNQIEIENLNLSKISPTYIRTDLSNKSNISNDICHSIVKEYVLLHQTYHSFKNINKIVAIIGPPGSGKSTIGKIIADTIKCKFISTGDIYRNTEFNNPNLFNKLESLKCSMKFALFANAISLLITTELYRTLCLINGIIIIEGLKCGNISDICKYIKPIDYIIDINADKNTLLTRIKNRESRIDDMNCNSRIDQYYKTYQNQNLNEVLKCKLKFNQIKYQLIDTSNLSIDETTHKILSFIEFIPNNST